MIRTVGLRHHLRQVSVRGSLAVRFRQGNHNQDTGQGLNEYLSPTFYFPGRYSFFRCPVPLRTYKSSSKAVNAARQAAADFDSMGDEADLQRIRMWAEEYAMHCGYKWLGIILYGGGKGLTGAEAVEERLKMQYAKSRKKEYTQSDDPFEL